MKKLLAALAALTLLLTCAAEGKLLWRDSREERASDFAWERVLPTEGQRRFAELTGLDAFLEKLDNGAAILRAYYTDGYGFSTSEGATEDPAEIEALLEALRQIEVTGDAEESVTDWYPQIVFYLSNGETFNVSFNARVLEIGGMDHYTLENDGDFWALTAALAAGGEA